MSNTLLQQCWVTLTSPRAFVSAALYVLEGTWAGVGSWIWDISSAETRSCREIWHALFQQLHRRVWHALFYPFIFIWMGVGALSYREYNKAGTKPEDLSLPRAKHVWSGHICRQNHFRQRLTVLGVRGGTQNVTLFPASFLFSSGLLSSFNFQATSSLVGNQRPWAFYNCRLWITVLSCLSSQPAWGILGRWRLSIEYHITLDHPSY